jgi:hypothetical protein
MTEAENSDAIVTEILEGAGARPCGRCGKPASVPAASDEFDGPQTWFCFECGHEEER